MNKQEAIEKINNMSTLKINDTVLHRQFDMIDKYKVLDIISQIHEPKKPVVPKYIADMIVEKKKQKYGIVETIQNLEVFNNPFNWAVETQFKWVIENQEDFVKAWLYGYEIKKEKLYTVELPNPNAVGHVVLCKTSDGIVSITFASIARWRGGKNVQLTEAEIKQDFEWAWQFAKEVKE